MNKQLSPEEIYLKALQEICVTQIGNLCEIADKAIKKGLRIKAALQSQSSDVNGDVVYVKLSDEEYAWASYNESAAFDKGWICYGRDNLWLKPVTLTSLTESK
jgi:hypothetical protein